MAVEKSSVAPLPQAAMPVHIAFIMDGNGRWAAQRGLPRVEGHRAGSKAMSAIVRYASKIGIQTATFYAFSTENWKRPPEEVESLMRLLEEYLDELSRNSDQTTRLLILGDLTALNERLRRKVLSLQERSAANTGITVNVAFNYGARDELAHAVRTLAQQCTNGTLLPENITEDTISQALYTAGQPDPDVIIRPSGELRLSNFLLWQAAYSELVFMDVLWPDFTPEHLNQALLEYSHRERRFGGRNTNLA